jgi:hypothetical protein
MPRPRPSIHALDKSGGEMSVFTKQLFLSYGLLLVYFWAISFLWSFLPDTYQWWTVPLVCSELFIGVFLFYFGSNYKFKEPK